MMKKTDALVNLLVEHIEHKDILEVACGAADFSMSASEYASSVTSIDIDDSRLNNETIDKINFQIMDAAKMSFSDQCFDTVIIYNGFSHILKQWKEIQAECMRVMKTDGVFYIISTWKLDTNLMINTFGDKAKWQNEFLIVSIKKEINESEYVGEKNAKTCSL